MTAASGEGEDSGDSDEAPARAYVETRVSLVLYGGVSLAVYISGVCQELLNVVRATNRELSRQPAYVPTAVEEVYADIGRTRGRRAVVDVMSGTSAGGLNAVFLAKALAHGLSLDALTRTWRDEADFELLINDSGAELAPQPDRQRPGVTPAKRPKSLLSADRFHLLLLRALEDMDDTRTCLGALVEDIDCYLTTTDLRGIPERIELESGPITEPRHRARFHFRRGTLESAGAPIDDFVGNDPILAFAARATAAHPAAFHPAQWDQARDLAGTPDSHAGKLQEHLRPCRRDGTSVHVDGRWYSDGGDMDNKPFSYALEPLSRRRAVRPVERRLLYVEPDPAGDGDRTWEAQRLPSLLAYTAGTYGLGRIENIRQDVEQIGERNEAVGRLTAAFDALLGREPAEVFESVRRRIGVEPTDKDWVIAVATGQIAELALSTSYAGPVLESWTAQTKADAVDQDGWAAVALESYRLRAVLREIIIAALQVDDDSPSPRLVGELEPLLHDWALVWAGQRMAAEFSSVAQPQRYVLMQLDASYRLRRLTLLEHLLGHEQRRLMRVEPQLAEDDPRFRGCRELRRELNALFVALDHLSEQQRRQDITGLAAELGGDDALAWLRDVGPNVAADLITGSSLDDLGDDDRRFARMVLRVFDERYQAIGRAMVDSSSTARAAIVGADFGDRTAEMRARLADGWINYDDFDQLLLPLDDVVRGELQATGVLRVSPLDGVALVDERGDAMRPRKLGGNSLGHFGGFFDEDWRLNDILWGRLDAAESIVRHVLVPGEPCDAEVERVHRAILADVAAEVVRRPSERSPLDALLEVNAWQHHPAHQAAADAFTKFCAPLSRTPGGTEPSTSTVPDAPEVTTEAVAEAFYRLLSEPGAWTIDLSGHDRRRIAKSAIYNRAVNVLGRVLAHHRHDPTTGADDPAGPAFAFQFVGRALADLVVSALPQPGFRSMWHRWVALTVRWVVYPLIVAAAVWGILAGVQASPRAAGAIGVCLVGWVAASVVRVRSPESAVPLTAVVVLGSMSVAALVAAFAFDAGAAALLLLSLFVLVGMIVVGYVIVPIVGGVLVTAGHSVRLPEDSGA